MADMRKPDELSGRQGPQVAKSGHETKRYSKRVIFLFVFVIGALLCLITMQAQFNRNGDASREQEYEYRAPRQEGFAELAAGMRIDRRKASEKPERTEPGIPEEPARVPETAPEKPARRIIIRTSERSAPPTRYFSNDDDAQAASALRTLKLQALSAKPLVEDFSPKESEGGNGSQRADGLSTGIANTPSGTSVMDAAAMAAIAGQGQRQDANMQSQKMDFLRGSGGSLTPQGYSENLPVPQQFPYELKAGTLIPGIMLTGINSDLPGNVIGQISENVWDTATGKFVLIPKGTRILGVYDSRVTFGQRRVLLVWNRLVFPNGTTLDIAGSPGLDQAGYSGLSGRVNEHWGTMLKSALLASVFVAGAEIIYDSDSQGNSLNKSPKDVAAESAAGAIIDMGAKLTDRAAGIQPTITVRPGKRMAIFVQQDIVFPTPYEL